MFDRYFLNKFCVYILKYSQNESNELLWWQKISLLESIGWRFIDYLEDKQYIS